jgi:hypothetical protein
MRKENEAVEVQVQFDDMTATIVAKPVAMFRVIKALINDGRDPEIRYFDEELKDNTCWQPTRKAA